MLASPELYLGLLEVLEERCLGHYQLLPLSSLLLLGLLRWYPKRKRLQQESERVLGHQLYMPVRRRFRSTHYRTWDYLLRRHCQDNRDPWDRNAHTSHYMQLQYPPWRFIPSIDVQLKQSRAKGLTNRHTVLCPTPVAEG